MTCEACQKAERNPRTAGLQFSGCIGCEARAIAASPAAHAREADPARLREAMRSAWPEESAYRRGRALVWEWIKRMEGIEA